VFTYNNFTHTPQELLELLHTLPNVNYIRFQIERGHEGNIHYQGYMHFSKRKLWGTIRRALIKMGLHRMAILNRLGSAKQADVYCIKVFDQTDKGEIYQTKLTEDIFTYGELDNEQGKRTDIVNFHDDIDGGKTNQELKRDHPHLYHAVGVDKIEKFRQDNIEDKYKNEYRDMERTFIYGGAGLGKTSFVYDKYPKTDIFRVTNFKGAFPFDGYCGQPVIILDEFSGQIPIEQFNLWVDRMPLLLNIKNGRHWACFEKVYITSNLTKEQLYPDIQSKYPEQYKGFLRRLDNIIKYTDYLVWHYEKQNGQIVQPAVATQTEMGMRVLTPAEQEGLPW
jgi:hypothetical protein